MLGQEKIREREAFVGRRRELAGLKAGTDEALAGRGCFFTLSGEPGVGKTRLAQETASYIEARGGRAIWGRCWDHGGAPAYWPWIQVIRALADVPEPARLATWLGPGAADIAQIAPELRDRLEAFRRCRAPNSGSPRWRGSASSIPSLRFSAGPRKRSHS
jgi:hypothetical protein